MQKLKLGDSELELLRYVARHPGCTVRDASEHFLAAKGWARTTVLKTLDRLREKELIDREEVDTVYRYRSRFSEEEVDQALVHQFFRGSLQGSLQPFVAYLGNQANLSQEDVRKLRELVDQLEEKEE